VGIQLSLPLVTSLGPGLHSVTAGVEKPISTGFTKFKFQHRYHEGQLLGALPMVTYIGSEDRLPVIELMILESVGDSVNGKGEVLWCRVG